MVLHKKHRVIIALGINDDVYSIVFFFVFLLFLWKKCDLPQLKTRAVIRWLR